MAELIVTASTASAGLKASRERISVLEVTIERLQGDVEVQREDFELQIAHLEGQLAKSSSQIELAKSPRKFLAQSAVACGVWVHFDSLLLCLQRHQRLHLAAAPSSRGSVQPRLRSGRWQ